MNKVFTLKDGRKVWAVDRGQDSFAGLLWNATANDFAGTQAADGAFVMTYVLFDRADVVA